ncbi:sensor histidine kinase [Thiocystis violascens]|nr:ATP-binding protein [Thiocystis violascens]
MNMGRTQEDPNPPAAPGATGAPAPDPGARYPTWGALRWLLVFRMLILCGLILVFSPAVVDPATGRVDTRFAWSILLVYAPLVLLGGLSLANRWPHRIQQVQIGIFVDILAYTLLMHAAGGIASGLGILLAVAVAAAALMMEGRLSLLFAALASLAIFAQQIYSAMQGDAHATSFTQAGLLGLLFFMVALMSHVLYRRVRSAEALAARRKVDIDDLSKLNDFIIQSIGTGILVADGERRLRLLNRAALDLLGAKRFNTGAALSDLSPELGAWLATQVRPSPPNGRLIHIGDREIRVSLKLLGDYRASGVILYLRDNREVAREAQQIKLASLGTLTASIAHNIRNPLSAMTHASQLLTESPGLTDDDHHLLEIVRRNGARIEETVHSVLQLSSRNQRQPSPIDLAVWLEEFAAEFRERHQLNENALQLAFDADAIAVEADPRHLHQILANLCENALIHGRQDAQPARILIRLDRTGDLGEALIEIIDAGPGIDAATVNEIFNPFYTTTSKGTGLGLYIARELAESNGIRLTYAPAKPQGSCFRLVFSG